MTDDDTAAFGDRYWQAGPSAVQDLAALERDVIADDEFRLLADHMPTLCWIADGDGYIVWYNRCWHAYCGTTPAEMEGWGWTSVHDPQVLPRVMESWRACIAGGTPFEMVFPLRGADGRFRSFLTRVQPLRAANGRVLRWFGTNTDVSRQLEAETARDAEHERRRAVLEHMGDGYVLLGPDFVVLDINLAALRMEDRPREAIVGRSHWEVWPGLEQLELGRLYKQAMRDRQPVSLEHDYRWADGRRAWIEMRAHPSGDGLAVFYRDVTDRKQAEAALRELNAELERKVVDRARERARTWQVTPDLLCVANDRGYLEACNPGWTTALGWSEAELTAVPFVDLIHPDDLPATYAAWAQALRGQPVLRFENRYRHKNGGYRWLSWVSVPVDGKVYCTAREVTEEKERAASLAARTAERDHLWNSSPDLLVAASFDGVLQAVNPAWARILGLSPEALIGTRVDQLIHPDDVVRTEAAVAHAARGELPITENRYRHADGSYRWIQWKAAPNEGMIYATGRDVTAEKQAAAELERAQEQLRQAQKMEAVGQLTGGIAHDFNNMLAVVIGSLDLLTRRLGLEEAQARRYVEAAQDGARRAAALTQRLLAFSRQQPLRPEVLDANRLVATMSDLLRHSLGAELRLETVLSGGLWRIHADPNQLENAILNLAVNARDAMGAGGRLTIETQNAHLDERYVQAHPGVPSGQYVLLAVTDSGGGMPAEVIAKAFDPFFTTKEVGKGTGLGLSQVYGFVKQSGGHVKIYSEPGQGTTVKLYLPRHLGEAGEAVGAELTDPALGDGHELVLVVEDEPAVRRFSAEALRELGYRVLEADGAAAALAILGARADVALLFTDVVMPDMNGRLLADRAVALHPALKVLFTTGYTRNAVVHNGVLDPGVELIGKPFTVDELAAKLRQVLDAAG